MVIYWLLFSPDKVKEIMFYILKKVEKKQALNRCLIKDQKWQEISDFDQFVPIWQLFVNIFSFFILDLYDPL